MPEILYEITNSIATITLNRPDKLNAFAGTMREELLMALRRGLADETVRVLILTGAGRAFCAGGDVAAMHATQQGEEREKFTNWLNLGGEIVRTIQTAAKPVLAAVNGVAAGAGCNLALACDLRYASETAVFSQAFIKLGLHPDWGGSFLLPRLIGTARAAELMLTGEPLHAQTALQIGLVNRVVAPELLLETVRTVAEKLAAASPQALTEIKKSLAGAPPVTLEAATLREREVQLELWASEAARQRIQAFVEKKK
ncbi:MAG: enoyl-CoA hydratase/isomerase family protein [Blastocatellia bacterium]|nr:enoyl-CoA hydratase/isomerase family protein [Blastocatellia bacterium]